MRRHALRGAGYLTFVTIVASLAPTAPVAAKDVRVELNGAPSTEAPLTPETSAKFERALNFDILALETHAPVRSARASTVTQPRRLSVHRGEHADGSSTISIAQPLSRDDDVEVGAELNAAAAPSTTYEPDKPLPGTASDNTSGAAWASLAVAPYATVDARVDPGSEQGTLGATLEHSVPFGDDMSVTLRGRYTISDRLAAPAEPDTAAPVLSNDQHVRLKIGSTGTTLSAGVHTTSTDPVIHNTLSADQKIYGPLHVTTAITDAGQPTSSKSVTAGFKFNW